MTVPSIAASPFHSPISEAGRFLPEGPRLVTVSGRSAIAWVNIQTSVDTKSGEVHLRFFDNGEMGTLPQQARPGFLIPTDREDTVFLGQGKEIGTLNLRTNEWASLARIPDGLERTIINDGEVTPGGRAIVFGTKDVQFKEPIASLYLFTLANQQLSVLSGNQTCSNGKVFDFDSRGLLLYDIDTPRKQVIRYRLDLAKRSLEFLGVALDLTGYSDFPDGMVACGDGTVIIAFYNPNPVSEGRARRFRVSDGTLLEEFVLPGSPRVTCPLLAKVDAKASLIFTTAVEGMPDSQRSSAPHAGDLFLAPMNLPEIPKVEVVQLSALGQSVTLGDSRAGGVNPPSLIARGANTPHSGEVGNRNRWVLVVAALTLTVGTMMGTYMIFKRGSGEIVSTLWLKYRYPDGLCSVSFPAAPKMEEAGVEGYAFLGGKTYTSYRWFEKVTVILTWIDLDTELVKNTTLEQIVGQQKVKDTERHGREPARESAVKLQVGTRVFEGIELQYQTSEGILVQRFYLEKDAKFPRLYRLQVTGPALKADSAAVTTFFNSFQPE